MDLDGDGIRDILSGCYSQRGYQVMVGSFWILRGLERGGFARPEELKGTDGETLMVHPGKEELVGWERSENTCTRPFAVDWDEDGDLDIVTGNFRGNFWLFEGEGDGKFSPEATMLETAAGEMLITAGRGARSEGLHSDPFVIDWDGDGDLDLLATSSAAEVLWAENTRPPGTRGAPVLSDFRVLLAARGRGPRGSTRMHIEDFDGDGKLDILMGDNGIVEGGGPREDLSAEERAAYEALLQERTLVSSRFREARKPWDREFEAACEKKGAMTQTERRLLYQKLVGDRMQEDEHYLRLRGIAAERGQYEQPYLRRGFVWLIRQR